MVDQLLVSGADLACDFLEVTWLVTLRVAATAHRCRSQELVSAKVANYEVPIAKRALNRDSVPLRGETDIFEGLIELVAPEGMYVVVRHAPVEERCRGGPSLLLGVVVVLDAYASKQRVSVVCNVSGGIEVRQARPAILVNFDAVRDPCSGCHKEIDLGV